MSATGLRKGERQGFGITTLVENDTSAAAIRTLMATDGSHEATTALRTASRLLRKGENEVHLLNVAPESRASHVKMRRRQGEKGGTRKEHPQRPARETEAILEQARQTLQAEGIEAEAFSETGSPATVIGRVADGFDVTVLGATSQYDRSRPGIGTVASQVVEHAPGIVFVAREFAGENNLRILLGVDGSLASRHALRALTAYFDVVGAEITLIHVAETPWIHSGLEEEWFEDFGDTSDQADSEIQMEREMRLDAEEIIEEARAELEKYDLSVESVIQEGNPATEILGEAEKGEYDLIVLGATGVSDVKHQMLGSVSARVAWQAPCSVAVVKYAG